MTPSWDFPRGTLGVRLLVATGEAHGLEPRECLHGSGLRAQDLVGQGTVEAAQEIRVARNLLRSLGDRPGLGVEAGSGFTPTSLGIWGFALATSPTFGDALSVGLSYVQLTEAFVRPQLLLTETVARVELHDDEIPADVREFLVERDLASLLAVVHAWLGEAPFVVHTSLDPPRVAALRKQFAAATVEGGAESTSLVVGVEVLGEPLPQGDPHAWAASARQCEALLDRRSRRTGVSAGARSWLLEHPGGNATVEDLAAHLHLHPRTVHRRLAAEGTTFRALRNEVNEALATELLSVVGLTVSEVARRLGYSDATSFHHAYRRWTGLPPSSVRPIGSVNKRDR